MFNLLSLLLALRFYFSLTLLTLFFKVISVCSNGTPNVINLLIFLNI